MDQLNRHENMTRLEPQNIGPLPRGQITYLSGREILDQLLKGALPMPHFGPTLRMSLVEVDDGRVVFSGEPVDAFANPFGSVHGGGSQAYSIPRWGAPSILTFPRNFRRWPAPK